MAKTEELCPSLLSKARESSVKFEQAFKLFAACHFVYDSAEYLDDEKIDQLSKIDSRILESIYFKGIIPSITYSIASWGSSKSLQTLEDIHIGAARFIFNIKNSTLSTEVLAATKVFIIPVQVATS